jgi:flagellar basal body-associated protein FliL
VIGTPCRPNQAKELVLTIIWIIIVIILVLLAIALVRRVL